MSGFWAAAVREGGFRVIFTGSHLAMHVDGPGYPGRHSPTWGKLRINSHRHKYSARAGFLSLRAAQPL